MAEDPSQPRNQSATRPYLTYEYEHVVSLAHPVSTCATGMTTDISRNFHKGIVVIQANGKWIITLSAYSHLLQGTSDNFWQFHSYSVGSALFQNI